MIRTLFIPKTVFMTAALIAVTYGPVYTQSAGSTPAPSAQSPQIATSPVPLTDITPPPATTSQNNENAVVLLDRIQMIANQVMSGEAKSKADRPLGTSGTLGKSGQVMIDRADLDEILADVQQLKIVMQTYKPAPPVAPVQPVPPAQ